MTITEFHKQFSFEKRKEEATRIKQKYSDRIPVIVQRLPTDTSIPNIDKKKYLVPNDLTLGQFAYVIRKRIKINPEQSIFIFVNNTLPTTSILMSQLFEECVDKDGFLYLEFSGENTFG